MKFFVVLLLPLFTSAQIITTIAGNGYGADMLGVGGYTGNGGPATDAELFQPGFICIDGLGNLLISDSHNDVIRKVNTDGIISTIAGTGTGGYEGDGGQATDAELSIPCGITVDIGGNIYFSELGNNVVRKINTAGIISTIAGTRVSGYTGDGGPATNAELSWPYGICIDHSGNIYIADALNYRVRKINLSGVISTIAGNGTFGFDGDGGPATAAQFHYLGGIAISTTGEIYISDYDNHRIRVLNTSGVVNTFAGNGTVGNSGDGGPATDASLNGPNSVTLDNLNNVYITDNYANVVRKVNNTGTISTIAGNGTQGYSGNGGPATAAELFDPNGMAINASGNLLFAEYDNNVVRKVTFYPEGINNVTYEQGELSVYPNPTANEITVVSLNKISQITINSLIGQTIYSHDYNSETIQIDVSTLPPGIYFAKINGTEVRKFVKE